MAATSKPYQPRQAIVIERATLEGALTALDALDADLILRRDEAREACARETYDEVLTVLDALVSEYRRRYATLPAASAHHASYVFLLDEQGGIHPLPHRLYVDMVRGKTVTPAFAGKTLRLAEWYVRLQQDDPETVVNETYSLLSFDGEGRIDGPAAPAAQPAALPNAAERNQMLALLFNTGFIHPRR